MEWIFIGIAVAIGFYLAPFVLATALATLGLIGLGLCRLFGGCR